MRILPSLLVLTFSAPAAADEVLGSAGESCRARSDCKEGLSCIRETCVDPNAPPPPAQTSNGTSSGSSEWLAFRLGGVHPFVGLTWAGGPVTLGITGNLRGGFNTVDGAFLFALHGGVFLGRHQLMFEVSPFTYVFDGRARGPAFQMNGSYAYFIPLVDTGSVSLHWPLRVGVGMMAGADNTTGLAYFQARADLVGMALQVGHVMFDFHVPSFRYLATDNRGTQGHILTWLIGASVSYVF